MAELSPEEKDRVGLTPDERIALVEERTAPSSRVGQAFSGHKSMADVLRLLPMEPDFDPVFTDPRLAEVERWLSAPGIYRLPWLADVADGDCEVWEERKIVDARRRPALARLDLGGDVFIVRLAADAASLLQAFPQPRHRIEVPPEPPELVVPAPDLASLLGDRAVPAWLQAAFEELSTSPYAPSRVAAVGLVVRGWGPGTKQERARETQRLIAGDGIATQARRWVQGLEAEAREQIEQSSIADAEALPDRLLGFSADAAESSFSVGLVAELFRARDDLASVAVALGLVGEGDDLRRALAVVDDELLAHGTALLQVLPDVRARLGADRLEALARLDLGESWWLSRL